MTNNEFDLAMRAREENQTQLEYYSVAFLKILGESLDRLNARVQATKDALAGDVTPGRRVALEGQLVSDRKVISAVQDVSSYLKVLSVKVEVNRVDISHIVDSILTDLKHNDPTARVKCFTVKSLYAYVDRDLIGIALRYLLSDSLRHVREIRDGKITFGLSVEVPKFTFLISDNRRYRAESKLLSWPGEYNADMLPQGEDLYLRLAKLIIEKNGGKVWAGYKNGLYNVHINLHITPTP